MNGTRVRPVTVAWLLEILLWFSTGCLAISSFSESIFVNGRLVLLSLYLAPLAFVLLLAFVAWRLEKNPKAARWIIYSLILQVVWSVALYVRVTGIL